jgi:hypothetical protein
MRDPYEEIFKDKDRVMVVMAHPDGLKMTDAEKVQRVTDTFTKHKGTEDRFELFRHVVTG